MAWHLPPFSGLLSPSGPAAACRGSLGSGIGSLGFGSREVPLETQSPQQIYLGAEALLADGRPREAGEQFSEVERLYPYSEWAKRAMLMSAFAYHEGGLYAESRAAAERYLEFFPADVDAPYAQFLIALSYYDQIVDIGRDQSNAFEALQEMRDIIERYPDSEYAKSAQMKFELALDHLAGKEMEIGRYYLAAASTPRRSTASASWSRTTRPRRTRPRRCTGWSRPTFRSG